MIILFIFIVVSVKHAFVFLFIDFIISHVFIFYSSKQKDLYEETFRDLVENVLQGFNGTIFAYGQTGTGKTHTMQGNSCFLTQACFP